MIARLQSVLSGLRFGQFLSVGIIGAICDNVLLAIIVETFGILPTVAKVISAEIAIIVMFSINEQWTFTNFGSSSIRSTGRRFVTSNLVRVVGVSIALVVLFTLHSVFHIWYLIANIAGIGLGFVVNYIAESLLTWRVHIIQ